jgi:ABC-type sugar transport system ATPase subunit
MMDEPTSALSASEVDVLFRVIRDLKSRGVAIVYISHRLEELLRIADTISVLRDGRMVAEADGAGVDVRWIVEQMTGRRAGAVEVTKRAAAGEQLMLVKSLSLTAESGRPLLRDVSLEVRAGEVLGIYGLMGAGRTELLECIMGLRPEMTGSVLLDSKPLDPMDTTHRIASGLAMVPEDRQVAGLVQSLSVLANMTMSSLEKWTRGAWLSLADERAAGSRMAADLHIKTPGLGASIGALSGGNQQKVVMAKCLLTAPRVLLLDEPTRGVDVGAKREIHTIVRKMAASGLAILLVSSELEEIRAVSDRILVMSRGRVTAAFQTGEVSESALAFAASATPEGRLQ